MPHGPGPDQLLGSSCVNDSHIDAAGAQLDSGGQADGPGPHHQYLDLLGRAALRIADGVHIPATQPAEGGGGVRYGRKKVNMTMSIMKPEK